MKCLTTTFPEAGWYGIPSRFVKLLVYTLRTIHGGHILPLQQTVEEQGGSGGDR